MAQVYARKNKMEISKAWDVVSKQNPELLKIATNEN
jgi:hypothetical protein